jgi:hypothetical protein
MRLSKTLTFKCSITIAAFAKGNSEHFVLISRAQSALKMSRSGVYGETRFRGKSWHSIIEICY